MDIADATTGPNGAPETKQRIRQVAEDLYVLRGHDGFSFGDVAGLIGTTRANIHHHFGNKRRLMTELVEGFAAAAAARIESIWAAPGASFPQRMQTQVDDLRRFYTKFNRENGSRNVWSPISRIRLDLPALGALAEQALETVNRSYDACLGQAVAEAQERGELRTEIAVADVVCLLRVTFLSCGPITQDTGSFADVERLLGSLTRLLTRPLTATASNADLRASKS
jgi:AcrR family transcriptional regulator